MAANNNVGTWAFASGDGYSCFRVLTIAGLSDNKNIARKYWSSTPARTVVKSCSWSFMLRRFTRLNPASAWYGIFLCRILRNGLIPKPTTPGEVKGNVFSVLSDRDLQRKFVILRIELQGLLSMHP